MGLSRTELRFFFNLKFKLNRWKQIVAEKKILVESDSWQT